LLLRGEEGECDPAFASKEDRDVALPFSDLGLCLGSCTCNPRTFLCGDGGAFVDIFA